MAELKQQWKDISHQLPIRSRADRPGKGSPQLPLSTINNARKHKNKDAPTTRLKLEVAVTGWKYSLGE